MGEAGQPEGDEVEDPVLPHQDIALEELDAKYLEGFDPPRPKIRIRLKHRNELPPPRLVQLGYEFHGWHVKSQIYPELVGEDNVEVKRQK